MAFDDEEDKVYPEKTYKEAETLDTVDAPGDLTPTEVPDFNDLPAEPPSYSRGDYRDPPRQEVDRPGLEREDRLQGGLQILGADGRPIKPLTPQQQFANQQNAMLAQLPPAMRQEYMLSQLKLSQHEQMRMSRMQTAIGAIKARDDLSDDAKLDLITQLQTGVNPYVQRQAKARMIEMDLANKKQQEQLKQMTDAQLFVRQHNAANVEKIMGISVDPITGERNKLGVDKDGKIYEIPNEESNKARDMEMKRMQHEADMMKHKEEAEVRRQDRIQTVVDRAEIKWKEKHQDIGKEVDKEIETQRTDDDIKRKEAKEKGVNFEASRLDREGMIQERLKRDGYAPSLEDAAKKAREAYGSPPVTTGGKVPGQDDKTEGDLPPKVVQQNKEFDESFKKIDSSPMAGPDKEAAKALVNSLKSTLNGRTIQQLNKDEQVKALEIIGKLRNFDLRGPKKPA